MKTRYPIIALLLMLCLATTANAQKTAPLYDPEALYDQGLILFQNGAYAAAIEPFSSYLNAINDPKLQKSVDAQYYIAVSALYAGQADAEAKIKAFVNENPGSTWAAHANFLYANVLFSKRKYADALALYEKTNPSSLTREEAQQLQFNLGYASFQLGEVDRALPIFQGAAINEGKYQQDAQYYYGYIQYLKGNNSEAIRYFELVRNHPVYGKSAQASLMQVNYKMGDYEAVLRDASETLRNADKKNQAELALLVADAYFQQKNYSQAGVYYTFVIKNNSRAMTRAAYYQMGVCRMKANDLKGAIADLQKAASDKDTVGQYASYFLASCYADTDQPKYARNAFYTAYSAGFDNAISEDALFNYAHLSLIPGTDPFNEAVAQLDAFVASHPQSARRAEAEELAVYLLLNAQHNDDALARLEKMHHISPELKSAYDELLFATGIEHYQGKRYDKAQACFSKILSGKQQGSRKVEATFWLAESAYAAGDFTTAERYFKQVKNKAANQNLAVMADYGLGYICYQKPDYDAATRYFKNFVQKCSDRDADLKSDAYIRLGDCSFVDRSYNAAIGFYDQATRINKRNADYALFQQGLCYGAKGNANQKINMLETMVNTYPSTSYYDRALFEIGNTHLVYGDKRAAIAAFNRLIKERPRSSYTRQALMKVGMIYYNNNQYELALTNLKTLIKNYPNTDESRDALSIVRNIYMEQNNLNEYFSYVEASGSGQVQVTQQDSLAFANAENFFLDGRYQDAEKALKYYFDHFSNGAYALKAHHYAAECAEKVGTEDEVKTHLNYLINQPDNDYTDGALLKLARIEYEHGHYDKAGQHYGRLANITEVPLLRLEALEGSMKSYFFLNNYDKAIEMGETLSQSKDLTAEQTNQVNHIVGKSHVMKGNYAAALQWLDRSAKADPSVYGAESAYYAAFAAFKMNRLDDAETRVFNIADRYGSFEYWVARSFILLADVYVAKENTFQARETLRSVVDNCTIAELKAEAQNKINQLPQ